MSVFRIPTLVALGVMLAAQPGLALSMGSGAPDAVSAAAASGANASGRVRHQRGWWQLWRPSKKTAAQSMAYANHLRETGSPRKAAREYRALVYEWPDSPEAPGAQLQFANLLFERGRLADAFNDYQFLVETYPGFFPYDQVIKRQIEIADKTAVARHGFLFITWSNQEDAVPMFEKIMQNAPTFDRSGRLQFRIGEIHEKMGEYELAVEAYTALIMRFPFSPHTEEAAFHRCLCHEKLTRYYPYSADTRAQAAMAAAEFLQRFPQSNRAPQATAMLNALDGAQAQSIYDTAKIYDRAGNHAVSAILMYDRLLDEYPDSPLAKKAAKRLKILRPAP